MPEVVVYDLITIARIVEVPSRCPNCDMLLVGPERETDMKLWEFQDQSRSAFFAANGDMDYGNDLPESGESYIEQSWRCGNCEHVLADAQEIELNDNLTGLPSPLEKIDKAIEILQKLRAEQVRGEPTST